jgi:hypothetical protein
VISRSEYQFDVKRRGGEMDLPLTFPGKLSRCQLDPKSKELRFSEK